VSEPKREEYRYSLRAGGQVGPDADAQQRSFGRQGPVPAVQEDHLCEGVYNGVHIFLSSLCDHPTHLIDLNRWKLAHIVSRADAKAGSS
jgi:hypothetical protein